MNWAWILFVVCVVGTVVAVVIDCIRDGHRRSLDHDAPRVPGRLQ